MVAKIYITGRASAVRVIAGTARGLRLAAPAGRNTRPTTDRAKESLFNIIAPDVEGSAFLDLFAGTGQIGIEALSRGAQSAVFVERGEECAELIQKNLERARFTENARIIRADYLKALTALSAGGAAFDIIFLDPPYGRGHIDAALAAIVRGGLLHQDGYVAAELSAGEPTPEVDRLKAYKRRDYGTASFVFLCFDARG